VLTERLRVESETALGTVAEADDRYASGPRPITYSGLIDAQVGSSASGVEEGRQLPEAIGDQPCHSLDHSGGEGVDQAIGYLIEAAG